MARTDEIRNVPLRDGNVEVVFDKRSLSLTPEAAKTLAILARKLEAFAGKEMGTMLYVERVEVSRTGVSFVISGRGVGMEGFIDYGPEGFRNYLTNRDELDWIEKPGFYIGRDGLVRFSYFFPEPERPKYEDLVAVRRGEPMRAVLGLSTEGEVVTLPLGITLIQGSYSAETTEMSNLILRGLHDSTNSRQLTFVLDGTTMEKVDLLLGRVNERNGQVVAVLDIDEIDFSKRDERRKYIQLVSSPLEQAGIQIILTSCSYDEKHLDRYVRPKVRGTLISGRRFNYLQEKAEKVDPLVGRLFADEWVRRGGGRGIVFLAAKLDV